MYAHESIKCKTGYYKFGGYCFRDCKDLNMNNFSGLCASSTITLSLEAVKRLKGLFNAAIKFSAFFFSAGTSSVPVGFAEEATSHLLHILEELFGTGLNLLQQHEIIKKLKKIVAQQTKEELATKISNTLMSFPINKNDVTCKDDKTLICKNFVIDMYQKLVKSEQISEVKKSITSYLDILGLDSAIKSCQNEITSSECVKSTLEIASNFDPTGIALALSQITMPYCKFKELNSEFNGESPVVESIWLQIRVNSNKNIDKVTDSVKCIEYDGYNKDFKIEECNDINGSQLFSFIKNANDNSYLILNKSGRVFTNKDVEDKHKRTITAKEITNNDNQRFYIVENGDNSNNKRYKLMPKNVEAGKIGWVCLHNNLNSKITETKCEDNFDSYFNLHYEASFQTNFLIPNHPVKIITSDGLCFGDLRFFRMATESKSYYHDEPSPSACDYNNSTAYQFIQRINGTFYIQQVVSQRFWSGKRRKHNFFDITLQSDFAIEENDEKASWIVWYKNKDQFILENMDGFCITKKKLVRCDSIIHEKDLLIFSDIKQNLFDNVGNYVIKYNEECLTENTEDQIYFDVCDFSHKQRWKFSKLEGPFYSIESVSRPNFFWTPDWSIVIGAENIVLKRLENNNEIANSVSYWNILPVKNNVIALVNKFYNKCTWVDEGLILKNKLKLHDCGQKSVFEMIKWI